MLSESKSYCLNLGKLKKEKEKKNTKFHSVKVCLIIFSGKTMIDVSASKFVGTCRTNPVISEIHKVGVRIHAKFCTKTD